MNGTLMRTVSLSNSTEISYRYRPGSQGDNVVLIHGLSQQSRYWDRVNSKLEQLNVISIDLPGKLSGALSAVTKVSSFGIEVLAEQVVELLDLEGFRNCHIVGHSWGASIAMQASIQFPSNFASCVLVDGGIVNPMDLIPDIHSDREALIGALTPPTGPFSFDLLMSHWGSLDPSHKDEVWQAVSNSYRSVKGDQFESVLDMSRHMAVLEALMNYEYKHFLPRISIPTWAILCLSGDSWNAAKLARSGELGNLPHVYLQRWYGYAHDVPLERPDAVADVIEAAVAITRDRVR